MRTDQRYEETLKDIETEIIRIYRRESQMTNHNVKWALEAAVTFYRARAGGSEPKPANLKGLEAELFERIKEACARWLESGADASGTALQPDEIVTCLRRLVKSVEFWTNQGGRKGYLDCVARFIA